MRDNGAVVNTAIAIATATGVIRKRDKSLLIENGGPLELTKNWAKSLLFRMGFVKRRGNTKAKVSVEHFETLKTQFLLDIKATVEMQEIPPELIINWDQNCTSFIMDDGEKRCKTSRDCRGRRQAANHGYIRCHTCWGLFALSDHLSRQDIGMSTQICFSE